MRIISSSSDTFTVGIQIYDNSGYPVRWDSLGKVNVSFEVAGYQAAGHSFDPQSENPEVELNASAFDGYPDGVLYYNYIATGYDASMTEILAEYTGRAQTDFFIQLTAAGHGATCATAVSELVNDAGYISGGELDTTLQSSFKTINGQSIIGSGNIEIQGGGSGGGSITVDSELSADSANPVQNRVVTAEFQKVNAAVSTVNGSIPKRTSQLTNDSGYITEHQSLADYYTKEQTNNLIPVRTSQLANDSGYLTEHQSLADYYTKEQTNNLIPTKTSQLTNDSDYVNGADVDNRIDHKMPVNVSQLANDAGYLDRDDLNGSFKTINGESIVGSGDIAVTAGGSIAVDAELSADSTNPVQNKVITGRINELAAGIPTKTSQLNNDSGYLTEHQSLENYYTKEQTDSSINAVKTAIPTKTSQLTNDSGYLTEHQSLDDYYTKSQVDSSINAVKTAIPTKTSQLTNDSGYLTEHQSLDDYYTKSQVDGSINAVKDAIPVNVSQLNNDSGYLTEHQSLDGYAKISAIPTKTSQLTNDSGYLTEHQSLDDYYTKSQVDSSINAVKDSIPVNVSQLTNDSGYLTEHQSLADYYTKEQTDSSINAVKNTIPKKTSQLTNDSGYLTEHQSLADYYTKSQTDAKIDEKISAAGPVNETDPVFTA